MFTLSPQLHLANKYFLTAGAGEASNPLNAFDNALLNSGIGNTNLIRISSIIPPKAKEIKPITLAYGSIIPVAYASKTSNVPGEIISCAVAVGLPHNENKPGLIMEYSNINKNIKEIELILSNMIKEGFEQRKENIKTIKIISKIHKVKTVGSVFAGAVLCYQK